MSVMHLAMLGCISFRVYADNFYGLTVNRTITINRTMTIVTEYMKPEEGAYHISNFTWYMIVMGAVIPLLSFPLFIYVLQQVLVPADIYVIRSGEDKNNFRCAAKIDVIPEKEKCLSVLCSPPSYVFAPLLTAMMVFFILGAVGVDYGQLDGPLLEDLVIA